MSEALKAKANIARAAFRCQDAADELTNAAAHIRSMGLEYQFSAEELFAMRDSAEAMVRRLEAIAYGNPL